MGPRVQQCRAGSRRAVDSVACAVEQRDRVGQQHAREQPRRRREERELRRAARLARPPDHARDEPVRRLVETHLRRAAAGVRARRGPLPPRLCSGASLLPRVRAPLRGRAEAGRERGVLEGEGLAAPAGGFGEGSEKVRVDSRGRRDRSAAARARGSGGARRRGRRTRGRTSPRTATARLKRRAAAERAAARRAPWRPLRRRRRAARSCRGRSFARSSSSRRRTQSSGRSRWRRRGALSRAEEACLSSRRRPPTRPSPEPLLGALPQPARPLGAASESKTDLFTMGGREQRRCPHSSDGKADGRVRRVDADEPSAKGVGQPRRCGSGAALLREGGLQQPRGDEEVVRAACRQTGAVWPWRGE